MAIILNLYGDPQCKTPAISANIGVAGITGYYADQNNWVTLSQMDYTCYRVQLSNVGGRDGVILSGGTPIFDFQIITDREIMTDPAHAITVDTVSKTNTTNIYNAVFAGIEDTSTQTVLHCNTIQFTGYESPNWFNAGLTVQEYTQQPPDATGSNRTQWTYNVKSSGVTVSAQLTAQLQQCVCAYKLNIWNTDFYAFAFGVSAAGEMQSGTQILLIPTAAFADREIKPYVGPVSRESAAGAYIGSRDKTDIKPRDISATPNPYGFNSVTGLYLVKMTQSQYTNLIYQIYNGVSGDLLNQLGQVITDLAGTDSKRPATEVQAIVNGIFCCHSVPVIGGYTPTGTVSLSRICGYTVSMFDSGDVVSTVNPLQQSDIQSGIIPRQTGCYLDFAPFTKCALTIPYFGTVAIDPSALLGNALHLYFTIDLYAGNAICTVSIIDTAAGVEWIYTTLHAKIGTELPIIGAGAVGDPIGKLANGISAFAKQGAAIGAIETAYSIFDGIQTAPYSTPITRQTAADSNAFLSPYECYLTVTTPNNFNAGDFWTLAGIPSHMSGNVGSFSGYTIFEHVDLTGVSGAIDAELVEIENTLRGGVWL